MLSGIEHKYRRLVDQILDCVRPGYEVTAAALLSQFVEQVIDTNFSTPGRATQRQPPQSTPAYMPTPEDIQREARAIFDSNASMMRDPNYKPNGRRERR